MFGHEPTTSKVFVVPLISVKNKELPFCLEFIGSKVINFLVVAHSGLHFQ